MKVIQVVVKCNRPVSVLLTKDMYNSMEVLKETRVATGVWEENQYLFTLPTSKLLVYISMVYFREWC